MPDEVHMLSPHATFASEALCKEDFHLSTITELRFLNAGI